MAGNTINIDLSVQDQSNSIKSRTSDAKKLNEQLERSQNLMRGTGTRTGNQAMRQAAFGGEVGEYNVARGVGERAGGSARDFADQARGLGGLVRLYAEIAANVFAVTAAFNALREAMNTQVMVKGMEQLGAASGTSLVSMSKSFVQATDGMVSFREAAEAVTKVTASGLGKQQVMDIATVAKGASQALGLNMSDAVSRLSRGITKLEPELLDELGIFTKLDKAVSDYARSTGKTEGQLTDFERRQAFANAVLEEGKKKFSEIAQAGNPYDQLLASLKNVATDILNVVNTVIGPIAKILADNTGLITAALALFAINTVGKVFPVLTNYRDRLAKTAEDTKRKAAEIAAAAKEREVFGKTGLEAKAGVPQAKEELAIAKAQVELLRDDRANAIKRNQTAQQRLDIENQITAAIARQTQAEKNLARAGELAATLGESPRTFSPTAYIQEKNKEKAGQAAARTGIVADISRQFDVRGIRESFTELNTQIKDNSQTLGAWGRVTTRVAGGAAILAQGVAQIGGFIFSKLLGPLSIAITLYETLNLLFDRNSKEMAKLDTAIDQLEDSTKTAADTNEKYKNSLSIDAVLAYANSIQGLNDNVQSVVKNLSDTKKAEGAWNKFVNVLKDFTPGWDSVEEKTSAGLGASLSAGIENIKSESLKADLIRKYKQILKIDEKTPLTPKTIEESLNKLDGFGTKAAENYKKAVEDLGKASEDANKQVQAQALYLKGLVDASDLASKSIQTFMNSLKDSSPMSQMLQNNVKYLSQLGKALEATDWRSQAAAIDSLAKTDFAGVFGAAAVEIARISDDFQEQKLTIDAVNASLEEQKQKLKELEVKPKGELLAGYKERQQQIAQTKDTIAGQEQIISNFESKFAEMRMRVAEATSASVQQMAEKAVDRHRLELAKLQTDFQKSAVGMLPVRTESSIQLQANLDKKAIDIETSLVLSQNDLANSIDRLRLEIENMRADEKIKRLEDKGIVRSGISAKDALARPGASSESQELENLYRSREGREKAIQLVDKGSIADIKAALKDSPEFYDVFARRLKQVEVQAGAAAKKATIDLKATIDTIKVKSEEAQAAIQFEIDKTAQIVSQIGSDTPEKLQAQIDFSTGQVKEQIKILETKREELIGQVDAISAALEKQLNRPLTKVEQTALSDQKTKIQEDFRRKATLIEERVSQENVNRAASKTAMIARETNEYLIKRLEIQKQLIRGESVEAFDQITAKNREILRYQQEIEIAEQQSKVAQASAAAAALRKELYGSGLDGTKPVSAEDAGRLASLEAVAASEERKITRLKILQGLTREAAKDQADFERVTKLTNIENAKAEALASSMLISQTNLNAAVEQQIKLDEISLGIAQSLGMVEGDNLKRQQLAIQTRRIDIQLAADLAKNTLDIAAAERALAEARRQAGTTEVDDGMGGITTVPNQTPQTIRAQQDLANVRAATDEIITNANRAKDVIGASFVPTAIEKFAGVWNQQFDKMTDSLMNFIQTGKFNFKDFMNSMIADFSRLIIKMQMDKLATSMFGGPKEVGGFFASLFGMANGGAFNRGVQAYARGGTFTNSIVNQPTLFKAAKGLGVMGEAGPEAIMPLRRDPMGRLGVSSTGKGNNVEIVVNNYGNEKATAKETTDGRGNRRIEVTVGDMVAGELSRTNSSLQRTFTNTYGLSSMVGRR